MYLELSSAEEELGRRAQVARSLDAELEEVGK